MTQEDILYFAEKKTPFFGRFWNFITKIEDYEIRDRDGELALMYCSGHGSYDWYYFKEYGKTWAFHLNELPDDVLDKEMTVLGEKKNVKRRSNY